MRLQDELGKTRKLMVVKQVDFGVYLGTSEERAKAASEGYDDDGYSAGIYMGYVVGATAQKAIDDECIAELEKKKALLIREIRNKNKRIAKLKATEE